jgi:hypothetical protein
MKWLVFGFVLWLLVALLVIFVHGSRGPFEIEDEEPLPRKKPKVKGDL